MQQAENFLQPFCNKREFVGTKDFFATILQQKRIFSSYFLHRHIICNGIDIQSISCPICDHGAETSDHLFFKCNMVWEIGRKIARWWNIIFEEVNSYDEWKRWIVSCHLDSKLKHMFEGIWYSLWWYVWNYRNKLLFDDKIPTKAVIFDNRLLGTIGSKILILLLCNLAHC